MIPSRSDLVAHWSEGLGDDSYRGSSSSLQRTVRAPLLSTADIKTVTHGQLILVTEGKVGHGLYQLSIEDRLFSGRTFRALEADSHLYSMGINQFTRLEG